MMQHITGIPGNQMVFSSLEDMILPDNPVRFVDAFVEALSIQTLGFKIQTLKTEGRPSFDSKLFLKIYLYGYLNGLRSCRKLQNECVRNIIPNTILQRMSRKTCLYCKTCRKGNRP